MYSVDVIFEEWTDSKLFIDTTVPEIDDWLEENDIKDVEIKDIVGHKVTPVAGIVDPKQKGGVSNVAYIRGKKYTFKNQEDAVLFKFRWGLN